MEALPPPGCPDIKIDLQAGQIEIEKQILFTKSKETFMVGMGCEGILDQVGSALVIIDKVCKKYNLPTAQFEVQGHTNAAPANRAKQSQKILSMERAMACIEYIVKATIDKDSTNN